MQTVTRLFLRASRRRKTRYWNRHLHHRRRQVLPPAVPQLCLVVMKPARPLAAAKDCRVVPRSSRMKPATRAPSIPRPERSIGTVRVLAAWRTGRVERSSAPHSAALSTRRRSPRAWTASTNSSKTTHSHPPRSHLYRLVASLFLPLDMSGDGGENFQKARRKLT